jgi:hypothetical protein
METKHAERSVRALCMRHRLTSSVRPQADRALVAVHALHSHRAGIGEVATNTRDAEATHRAIVWQTDTSVAVADAALIGSLAWGGADAVPRVIDAALRTYFTGGTVGIIAARARLVGRRVAVTIAVTRVAIAVTITVAIAIAAGVARVIRLLARRRTGQQQRG